LVAILQTASIQCQNLKWRKRQTTDSFINKQSNESITAKETKASAIWCANGGIFGANRLVAKEQ